MNGLDSAAGSCKDGRDPRFQAILPIFGKVKNAVKDDMTEAEVLQNDKLGLLYAALGCGIDEDFDINKLRYSKIMLFADADQNKVVLAGMQRIMNSLTLNERCLYIAG